MEVRGLFDGKQLFLKPDFIKTATVGEATTEEAPPSVAKVCDDFGLTDVDLEYTDADYQNLTTNALFQQKYGESIQALNVNVSLSLSSFLFTNDISGFQMIV